MNNRIIETLSELTDIGDNRNHEYEKRLYEWAAAANTKNAGPFDSGQGVLSNLPKDLKHIRHYRLGHRHRIYISGNHRNCVYDAWHIKTFKQAGKLEEGSDKFNRILAHAHDSELTAELNADGEYVPLDPK